MLSERLKPLAHQNAGDAPVKTHRRLAIRTVIREKDNKQEALSHTPVARYRLRHCRIRTTHVHTHTHRDTHAPVEAWS
jgi:hypothetical protein